jgi:hypothetical protein
MKKILFVFALLVASFSASAGWNAASDYAWATQAVGKVTANLGIGPGTVWQSSELATTAAGIEINRIKNAPFTPSPSVLLKSKISPATIGKALSLPSAAVTLIGGALIAQLLDRACVRIFGGSMQLAPGGQWEECGTKTQTLYQDAAGGAQFSSISAAVADRVNRNHIVNPLVTACSYYPTPNLGPSSNRVEFSN